MTAGREHAHQLIDCLPDAQYSALVHFLETMIHPVAAALQNAPLDDEPDSGAEQSEIAEARQWLHRNGGKGIPHQEAMRRLGLD